MMSAVVNDCQHRLYQPIASDSAILKQWLRQSTIETLHPQKQVELQDAVLVGIDVEWYEHDSDYITELGFTVIDPRAVWKQHWPRPWDVFLHTVAHHVRIRENAHMINSDLCDGYPDKFHFGRTKFVTMDEASEMLTETFMQLDRKKRRSIIFLGHAVDNDIKMLQKYFNIDWNAFGTIHIIDTQVIAREMGFASPGQNIGLARLLAKLGIQEPHLHNAGNDIVCTTLAAVGMMGRCTIPDLEESPTGQEYYNYVKSAVAYRWDFLLNAYEYKSRVCPSSFQTLGCEKWCTNCEHQYHNNARCETRYQCQVCGVKDHKTEKCLQPIKDAARAQDPESPDEEETLRFPIPCASCIVSTDTKRNSMSFAYGHLEKECPYKSRAMSARRN